MIVITVVSAVCFTGVVAPGVAFGWKTNGSELQRALPDFILGGVVVPAAAVALAAVAMPLMVASRAGSALTTRC
ncbi:MAG: hypothetical protein JNL50_12000 [Phycisphaerae bacterium]|nr:hypothetical protein [Phycisphaerae bacterium]